MPTNYFVDSTTGNDLDSGLTMDLAWATLERAVETAGLVPGDVVWVRRIHVEYAGNPTSYILPVAHGSDKLPIKIIGWPRNTHAVASSDWTNGNTTVVIDDADMDREKHCGRFITAPDGYDYLITKITDASHIVIDRKYVGPTVANQAATIKADEDYALAQAIDDSGWTINKAAWNADADDMPCIDFKDQAFGWRQERSHYYFANLEFRDSTYNIGLFRTFNNKAAQFWGCLFHQDNNFIMFHVYYGSVAFLYRCILDGNGVGANQVGLRTYNGEAWLRNSALYGFGDNGIFNDTGTMHLDNVNIGVEVANGDDDIRIRDESSFYGRDIKLGGTNGYIDRQGRVGGRDTISFENYGKILGTDKVFTNQGVITKVAAGAGGDIPNQRAGGATNLVEILYNLGDAFKNIKEPEVGIAPVVFIHEFDVDTSTKTYRYYVQSMANLTAIQLWLELEYVVAYDDETKYMIARVFSDEAVAVRANLNDWSQYIEIPNITPAVASRVRIKCKCSYFHATNKIYIDPGDFNYLPTSLCAAAGQFIPGIRLHGA